MESVYTCTCGNQTWTVLDNSVRCAVCGTVFQIQNTPTAEFNRHVTEELEELEEA